MSASIWSLPSFDIGEDTDGVLSNLDSGYRVILVGDAMMAPEELYYPQYDWRARSYGKQAGIDYLRQLKERYDHIIWLNPQPRGELSAYWATSYDKLAQGGSVHHEKGVFSAEGLSGQLLSLLDDETGWHRLSRGFMEFTSTLMHCSPKKAVSSGVPLPRLCPGTSKGTTRIR